MNRRIDCKAWVIVAAMLSYAPYVQSRELAVSERYDEFIRSIDAQSGLSRADAVADLGSVYDTLFPMRDFQSLEALDDQGATTTFMAAANAVRMIGRPSDLRQAELAFDELLSRGLATEREVTYMHGAYIQMRMLEDARRFEARHPDAGLVSVPALLQSQWLAPGQPTELVVSHNGDSLFRRAVDLSGPTEVVVVAHPGCRFSREAMLAIEADPVLSGALRGAKWLIPPGFRFDTDAVQRWNRAHPATTLTHAYDTEEWPQLDYWGTPTFYFFRDGALEDKVTGWPKGGRRDELLAALRDVGMLPAEE